MEQYEDIYEEYYKAAKIKEETIMAEDLKKDEDAAPQDAQKLDDALDTVAGGVDKSVPATGGYWVKPAGVYTGYAPSDYYARPPEEDPDYVAPQVDSGGWTCAQCGATYSGPAAMKPDKCNCGGEWIRVL